MNQTEGNALKVCTCETYEWQIDRKVRFYKTSDIFTPICFNLSFDNIENLPM